MMQGEKERIITLFSEKSRWCQQAEARDEAGTPVCYYAEEAIAWDLVGGMCLLFGWERAQHLFPHFERCVARTKQHKGDIRNRHIAAMSALLDFDDQQKTTYLLIINRLREMPVYFTELVPAGIA